MSLNKLAVLSVVVLCLHGAYALTCYENDDDGNVFERTNSSWTYCQLVPFPGGKPTHHAMGRLSGIGPAVDNTENIDGLFGQSNKIYKVLTLCVMEKYDFGALSPAFRGSPEFMFRCLCNYDLCNEATTFAGYLNSIRGNNE